MEMLFTSDLMFNADNKGMKTLTTLNTTLNFVRLKALDLFAFSLFLLFFILLFSSCSDEPKRAKGIKEIAFGFDNDQTKNQSFFKTVAKIKPDVWLWVGNSINHYENANHSLKADYYNLIQNEHYYSLRDSVKNILGTWDIIESGKMNGQFQSAKYLEKHKKNYLKFLKIDKKSDLYKRNGLYSSFTVGEDFKKIKFIFLDTQTFSDTLIPNQFYKHHNIINDDNHLIGEIIDTTNHNLDSIYRNDSLKLNKTNFINNYYNICDTCKLLGEEQWQWLYNTLKFSDARINIIVSSLPVFYNDNMLNQWKFYSKEKERLFKIIQETNPKNIIFITRSEKITKNQISLENYKYPIYEISSGPLFYHLFKHLKSENKHIQELDDYEGWGIDFEPENQHFGLLTFDWKIKSFKVKFDIYDKTKKVNTYYLKVE